jgi:hypothetical protein
MKTREQILAPGSTDTTVASADVRIRSTVSLDVYVGNHSWMWKICLNKAELKKHSGYETHANATAAGLREWTKIVSALSEVCVDAVRSSMTATEATSA